MHELDKSEIHWKACALPGIHFEDRRLAFFAVLAVFQSLFDRQALTLRLRYCLDHLKVNPICGHALSVRLLIVHLLIGSPLLSDLRYWQDNPMVGRAQDLNRLPDLATVSRTLLGVDKTAVRELGRLSPRPCQYEQRHLPGAI